MAVVVETLLRKQKASARWRIGGVSLLGTKSGDALESGEMLDILGFKFGLRLYWGGKRNMFDEENAFCSLYAYILNQGPETLRWQCEVRLICQSQGPDFVRSEFEAKSSKSSSYRWKQFKARSEILGSGYVLQDNLILELAVEAWPKVGRRRVLCSPATTLTAAEPRGKKVRLESSAEAPCGTGDHSALSDFGQLLRSGEGSDVVLCGECSDEAPAELTFRAHRAILSARSPVFQRMFFGAAMQEAVPGATVKLAEVEPRALGWLLEYIYTERIDSEAWEDDEALCHLLAVADRYEVVKLVSLCEFQVARQLRPEVAVERLLMAERLNLEGLRSKVLDYMCSSDERLGILQGSEDFARLKAQQPQLMADILNRRFPGR
mmetsp:Transcript_63220/g.137490  ORF Transcript_63220/g.137490 Transcript_63220/m.137490 type:complete len:378 (-) Transcript_63220:94-1227(-)